MSEHTQTAAGNSDTSARQMGADSAPAPSVPLRPASPRPEGDVTPTQRRAPFCLTPALHDLICGRPALWDNPGDHLSGCTAGHLIDSSGEQS